MNQKCPGCREPRTHRGGRSLYCRRCGRRWELCDGRPRVDWTLVKYIVLFFAGMAVVAVLVKGVWS